MDLKDLYRDVIVDHNRKPRNFGPMVAPDAHADGHNPLCGDRLTIYVSLDGDTVKDAKFEGARLVGFEVEAFSVKHTYKGKWGVDASLTSVPLSPDLPPQPIVEAGEYIFTYDVQWEESPIR